MGGRVNFAYCRERERFVLLEKYSIVRDVGWEVGKATVVAESPGL